MKPDLEVVHVLQDQSFKIWSHGHPYRTIRWHFHPEYELHLVTATEGNRYVGDHIGRFCAGDLVLVGPNLPHNWISDVPVGATVEERCLVLQFTHEFITSCMTTLPELRFLQPLLNEAHRGVLFGSHLEDRVGPLMRKLLYAADARKIALFMEIIDIIGHAECRVPLASVDFLPDSSAYLSTAMNPVLQYISRNFTRDLSEGDLARLSRQSISTFSRAFKKHTGMTFVQHVNSLRIALACQHLSEAELTVTEICYEVGFNNVSNFNRQFLAMKGIPPSKFRTLCRHRTRLADVA